MPSTNSKSFDAKIQAALRAVERQVGLEDFEVFRQRVLEGKSGLDGGGGAGSFPFGGFPLSHQGARTALGAPERGFFEAIHSHPRKIRNWSATAWRRIPIRS